MTLLYQSGTLADTPGRGEESSAAVGARNHGKDVLAALEMFVRENAPPHDGQGRVGTDEILRRIIDEIEQLGKRFPVEHHGGMLCVDGDAVLIEIGVRGILPEPILPRELQRHRAHVAAGSPLPHVSDVFAAEHALGIAGRDVAELCRQLVVFLRLAQIDRDFDFVLRRFRQPIFIARDRGKLDVIVFDAEVVQPVEGLFGALRIIAGKFLLHLGGAGSEQIEQAGGEKFLLPFFRQSLFPRVSEQGRRHPVRAGKRGNFRFVREAGLEGIQPQPFDEAIGKVYAVLLLHAEMNFCISEQIRKGFIHVSHNFCTVTPSSTEVS